MFTIVGLGNPGIEYESTRHNAGRIVLTNFLTHYNFPKPVVSNVYGGQCTEGMVERERVRVLFPKTYMNESGSSVAKVMKDADRTRLIVVHDELDLALGTFKISRGSGSGGHRGVDSVIRALGSNDFVRVRIGIAPVSFFGNLKKPQGEGSVSRFVLGTFGSRERKVLEECMPNITNALVTIMTQSVDAAMNTYN